MERIGNFFMYFLCLEKVINNFGNFLVAGPSFDSIEGVVGSSPMAGFVEPLSSFIDPEEFSEKMKIQGLVHEINFTN